MDKVINQCDGCRRGLPLNKHGYHNNPNSAWDFIGCTAYLYRGDRMAQFFCSFADNEHGFRGAVIAEGKSFKQAYEEINRRGLNPGGEVASVEITPEMDVPPGLPTFQLLSKDDLAANGGFVRHGDMPKDKRDYVMSKAVRVCQACNEGRCTVH